jgi:hypothetical protein
VLDALKELLGRTPFEPFRVKMLSGDAYDVGDPLSMVIYQSQGHAFLAITGGHWATFRLDFICCFESLVDV